ncbi:MAG: helix-turn-helix domain-containing protein [Firmicutes bacterium]|nr:helix-turn-helix domain-containing protein [Bacillota bacterium]
MDYISVQQAAEKWGVSIRRVQQMCDGGRINGAMRFSRVWMVPKDAEKPADARMNNGKKGKRETEGVGCDKDT